MGGRRSRAVGALGAVVLVGTLGAGCATDVSGDIGSGVIRQFDLADSGTISVCQVTDTGTRGLVVGAGETVARPLVGPDTANNCPYGVNSAGTVVGQSGTRAGTWSASTGAWQPLPLPEGTTGSVATDINDAGLAVGSVSVAGQSKPIIWNVPAGTFVVSPPQFAGAPEPIHPRFVNDRGSIVARVQSSTEALFFADPAVSPIVGVSGNDVAFGLAENDDVVAMATRKGPTFPYESVILHTDARTRAINVVTVPGTTRAGASDIDDRRRIVGGAEIDGVRQAIRYDIDTGTLERFGADGGTSSYAYATNDRGQIAGIVTRADGSQVVRVWG